MDHFIQSLQKINPLIQHAKSITRLSKGFSPEKKYMINTEDRKLLLRVSESRKLDQKKQEVRILKELRKMGVRTPEPYEVGMIEDPDSCYTLYSFLDGIDGIEALTSLTEPEQYNLGVEVGEQLSKMHTYQAPAIVAPWYDRAMAKHYRYFEAYKTCGIEINQADKVAAFIEENKHLLKGRPNQLQHDDIHLGNIIINDKKYAGVIDFSSFDWGDPLHDFVKVGLFQRELSIPFSRGQIMGYFNGQVPDSFWRLYSVYVAMVVFSSIVWSLKSSPEQVEAMIKRVNMVLVDHQYFKFVIPTWFE